MKVEVHQISSYSEDLICADDHLISMTRLTVSLGEILGMEAKPGIKDLKVNLAKTKVLISRKQYKRFVP